jgi:hypothetical protein
MKDPVKRLLMGALLVAFGLAPSLARGGTINAPPAPQPRVAEAAGELSVRPTPAPAAAGVAGKYAAREAAAPELGNFKGGSGLYIGGGTLVVVLLIVIIILLI